MVEVDVEAAARFSLKGVTRFSSKFQINSVKMNREVLVNFLEKWIPLREHN
jgi:uncharacterized protein YfdQ (DUF2303 family)